MTHLAQGTPEAASAAKTESTSALGWGTRERDSQARIPGIEGIAGRDDASAQQNHSWRQASHGTCHDESGRLLLEKP